MDVAVTLSPSRPTFATFRRLANAIAEVNFSIEVPAEENIATVGSVLNSNTIVQINAVLARSSVLSEYGAEAVALYVDGFPAKDRSAEVRTSTQFGAFPLWVCPLVPIIFLG